MAKGTLLGALVQLGYKSPTDDEEVILDVVKGHNIFVSLSAGRANRCAYTSLMFIFDNTGST